MMTILKKFSKLKNLAKNKDRKALISNFGYLTILQMASYVFPFITIPYLSRVIGAEGYGKIAFAAAVMIWIQTVADWGFTLTATRDVAKNRDDAKEISRIFSVTFWARCLLTAISFLILCVLILTIKEFHDNALILLITFLTIPGHIMFPDWFFQAIERMKYLTITNLVVKFIFTISVFIFIKEKEDYIFQPLLTSVGFIVAGFIAMYIILYKWKYKLHFIPFKDIITEVKRSSDVFINNLFPNLYNSFSTVLLGFWGGPVANGIYSEGGKLVNVFQNFLNVIQRVFFPFLSRRIDKHITFVKIYVGTSIAFAVVLILISSFVIDLLYTDEFVESAKVMKIMAISIIFLTISSAYGTNYMIVQGHEKLLRKITIFCSLFGFAISFPLVYAFSYIGAAITVAVSRLSLALSSFIAVRKIKKNNAITQVNNEN